MSLRSRATSHIALAGAAASLALASGCVISRDFSDTNFLCVEEPTCPGGFVCVEGRCVPTEGDEIRPDGGTPTTELRYRRELTLDTGGRGPLAGVPLMVRLDPDRIDYDVMRADGGDLQFFDAAGTPLPHEIEIWSPGAESIVWVGLARLGSADSSLWMYWGDPDTQAPQDPAAVWSAYRAVYHLGGAASDSTAQGYHGTPVGGETVTGLVGQARRFDGVDDRIDLGVDRAFASGVTGATVEAWVRPGDLLAEGNPFASSINGDDVSRVQIQVTAGRAVEVGGRTEDGGGILTAASDEILAIGTWTWIAAVYDFSGDSISIYFDGELVGGASGLGFGPATPDTAADTTVIGVDENLGGAFFLGDLDEIRISGDAKSPDWIAAQHAAMRDQTVAFGPVETL